MPDPKAPYSLKVKLTSARPDAIGEALAQLRQLTSDHDLTGESTATLTIECFKEAPLSSVRELFELWLYGYKIALECEVTSKAPGLRPETAAVLRANHATPMDDLLGDGVDSVTLSGAGRSVTLTAETGERAKEWSERTRRLHAAPRDDQTPGEKALEWLEAREQD